MLVNDATRGGCVRYRGVVAAILVAARATTWRECSARDVPVFETFDADNVSAGGDLTRATVVWHVHRPDKEKLVVQLLAGEYADCCAVMEHAWREHEPIASVCPEINPLEHRICARLDADYLSAAAVAGVDASFAAPDPVTHTRCRLDGLACNLPREIV